MNPATPQGAVLECLFLRVKDDSLSPRWAPRVPPAGLILREVGDGFCFKKKLMVLMVSKQPLTLAWGKPTSTTQLPTKHRRNSYSRRGAPHKYENRPQPSRNQVLPNSDCGSRKTHIYDTARRQGRLLSKHTHFEILLWLA